jgi:dolichyl-diphosphooligosaccharide---protein glycosyltransferase
MVGVHATLLVPMGRFSNKVWASYSLFYVVGTTLAIQVPVIGWAPLKSLELLGPCVVFLAYQILQLCEVITRKQKLSRQDSWKLRVQVSAASIVLGVAALWILTPSGYFGPLSSRVRGLFVQHTKTGNPLVDSVAEHQPASSQAYFQYLHHVCSVAPIGYIMVMFNLSDSSSFLLAWGTAAYFFSHKMVRLVLLTAPIGSVLGGIACGRIFAWCLRQVWDASKEDEKNAIPKASPVDPNETKDTKKKKPKKTAVASKNASSSFDGFTALQDATDAFLKSKEGVAIKRVIAVIIMIAFYIAGVNFKNYCFRLSVDLSHPTIIQRARLRDGRIVKIDDYREAYWWLRDNTPPDARIMAWWDYGYQITAISNRTTLADGNTWNHEHIALLGKALTTDLDEGYEIARHLADYVLLWGGGGGDDLAKSPHLARIANSVYRDHCPGDPTCRAFGFVVSGVLCSLFGGMAFF